MPSVDTFTFVTGSAGAYDWSLGANWSTAAVPVNGGAVVVTADAAGDISVDNIASLSLSSLTVNNLAVGRSVVHGVVEIAAGDTLAVTGAVSGAGTIALLGVNTVFEANAAQISGVQVAFDPLATSVPETLVLTGPLAANSTTTDSGSLLNFYYGDTIDIQGLTNISTVVAGSTLRIVGDVAGGGTATYVFNTYQAGQNTATFTSAPDGSGGTLLEATCFAAGTRILTPGGERDVETLAEGDSLVVVRDGVRTIEPVSWIGRLRVDLARSARPETVAPIRFRRDALAEGVPHRDVLLSPEHCVLLDGHLVAAKCLVNGASIVQERRDDVIEYFHIETATHGVVLADGLPAETFLDTGNRAVFDNAGAAMLLRPEFHINAGLRSWARDACAPLATTPEVIRPIWERLAARAEGLGFIAADQLPRSGNPMPLLSVDGRLLAPSLTEAGRISFVLPRGGERIFLVTRYGSPAELAPWLNDHRRLGVAVERIEIVVDGHRRVIAADDPALCGGWHPAESDGVRSWRWTDGRAWLPVSGLDESAVIDIRLSGEMTYRVADESRLDQAA